METGYEILGITGTAAATNGDGSIVVGANRATDTTNDSAAYRLDWASGRLDLYPESGTGATAVSDDARVVTVNVNLNTSERLAWLWYADGSSEPVQMPADGDQAEAYALSGDGSVVTGWADTSAGIIRGIWYDVAERRMVDMGTIPGSGYAIGMDASADGTVVVGESFSPGMPGIERAFRWTEATGMVDLGVPPEFIGAYAVNTNADGSVIAIRVYKPFDEPPFDRAALWDSIHGLRMVRTILTETGVDLEGWTLRHIVALSADGTVAVGCGTNPDGDAEPWMARLEGLVR
jgi:probable HAF family extracellular repeat protein